MFGIGSGSRAIGGRDRVVLGVKGQLVHSVVSHIAVGMIHRYQSCIRISLLAVNPNDS